MSIFWNLLRFPSTIFILMSGIWNIRARCAASFAALLTHTLDYSFRAADSFSTTVLCCALCALDAIFSNCALPCYLRNRRTMRYRLSYYLLVLFIASYVALWILYAEFCLQWYLYCKSTLHYLPPGRRQGNIALVIYACWYSIFEILIPRDGVR